MSLGKKISGQKLVKKSPINKSAYDSTTANNPKKEKDKKENTVVA